MKTFDEKDLITWANREKAVIGNEYYFADSMKTMLYRLNGNPFTRSLEYIDENDIRAPFYCNERGCSFSYVCMLPVDAVKDVEPEKTYRACETIKEFYELVSNSQCKVSDEECIYQLISDFIVHIRSKSTGREYYSRITNIAKDGSYYTLILEIGYSLLDLFNKFEIEIKGKWQPFGVLDDN